MKTYLNGKYNFPIGLEFYHNKYCESKKVKLIKCIITGHVWISPEVGGVYEALAEEEVEGMDCNWRVSSSIYTSACDKTLTESYHKYKDKIII